ncbi:MAG: hypothetical protein WDN00_06205 [Limisphaerales bacterium]
MSPRLCLAKLDWTRHEYLSAHHCFWKPAGRIGFHRGTTALGGNFQKPQPLEVELGCGDASFLAEYARRNLERNFIGVERLLGRMQKLDRKGRRAGLTNLRGVRIESAYFLQYLLPPNSASALHIYFPRSLAEEETSLSPAHQ